MVGAHAIARAQYAYAVALSALPIRAPILWEGLSHRLEERALHSFGFSFFRVRDIIAAGCVVCFILG